MPVGTGKKQESSLLMEVDFLSDTPWMIGPFKVATDSHFVLENKQLDKTVSFPKNPNDSGIAIVSIFSPTDRWLDSLGKGVADALQGLFSFSFFFSMPLIPFSFDSCLPQGKDLDPLEAFQ